MSPAPKLPDRKTIFNEIKEELIREYLKRTYRLNEEELKKYLREEEVQPVKEGVQDSEVVPVSIFNDVLSPLEAIVKYLKEVRGMRLVEIAKLTGRDQRAIGVTYRAAIKKMPEAYVVGTSEYMIPVHVLQDKKLTVSEHIVKQLKEVFKLNYHEVAVLMKRNDRTVWTLYNRAIKKNVV